MQVMRRFRIAAVAVTMAGLLFSLPRAEAGLLTGPASFGLDEAVAIQDTAVASGRLAAAPIAAEISALHLGVPQAPHCNTCDFYPTVATAPGAAGTTLPVNVAILVLGSLWLTLMARRIQQRTAANRRDDASLEETLQRALTGGVPQHAAGGR
jgi:hypothetical protein